MNATSIIQVLKVGDLENKEWEGRKYQTQECECILLNADGSPESVGVLRLADNMKGDKAPTPGRYTASFALFPARKDRRIEARLVGLVAIPAGREAARA
jgi:hypothetical protein